jgi:hypothetical protein
MALTIKDIEERGMIAYKYIAGSHSQNLNGPDSCEKILLRGVK